MSKCLRCGATDEWIQGRVAPQDAERITELETELAAALAANESLVKDLSNARRERDEFQSELQKVCDHDWQHIDDSFDHEFGIEQLHSCLCEKCGATKPYEPETFGDEAI